MVRFRCAGICAGIAIAGLALRLLVLVRPSDVVDRLFVPDDAYYTLSVARSLGRGLGPAIDGRLTSGFQPLLAFLLVAAPTLRTALVIGALADFATTLVLAALARRAAGERAAWMAAALWAASPTALGNALNGLETSLAVALAAGAALAWDVALEREASRASGGASTGDAAATRAWLGLGALLGACLLARVDTVFLVAIAGAWSVVLVRRGAARAKSLGLAIGAAAAVVGPWWTYAVLRFGTFIPESGAAVREQALAHRETGTTFLNQLGWASGASLGPLFADATDLREALGSGAPALGAIALAVLVYALVRAAAASANVALRALSANAIALLAFYSLYLPAVWFFRRYLAPVEAVVVLVVAIAVARAAPRGGTMARVAAGAFGVLLATSLATDASRLFTTPDGSADLGHNGAKGYAAPARAIVAAALPGAVIGSMQSGALSWFADGVRVVNLDGVVDADARRALAEGHICAFARERGITHLADWKMNVDLFLARCGAPAPSLVPLADAPPQGEGLRFTLYAIAWR